MPRGRRARRPRRGWLGLRIAIAAASFVGCGPPDTPGPAITPQARKPDVGPWFVDRARDFGLDVVTRLGQPDKPSVLHAMGTGVALFDADGDGDLDLFVVPGSEVKDGRIGCAGGPWLFRNDGPGRWSDATSRSGLAWTGWAQGVAVGDYDADGDFDLFVAQHGPDTLWRNRGNGTFEDVTGPAGLRDDFWGVSATWGDADGDGWPDLYVTNYLRIDPVHPPPRLGYMLGVKVFAGPTALPGEPDRLWRNRGDGTFEDATAPAGLERPDGKGMGAVFSDLDEDGLPDLYVTNDTQANEWFRNLGSGRFEEVAMASGLAVDGFGRPEGSMGIARADLDGDGRLDLAFSNFRQEGTRVHRHLGGLRFEDISMGSFVNINTQRFVGWGIVLADFDDDGWVDASQANGHVYPNVPDSDYDQPPIILKNRGKGVFLPITPDWGPDLDRLRSGRGLAVGDLDEDGDLDLVMTTMDGPLRVLINEGRRTNHACRVRLIGRAPNTEALGARVELEAGGRTHVGEVGRGGSILSASDIRLHFGLGEVTAIDRLRIRWPDGTTRTVEAPPVDALLIIRQGKDDLETAPFPSTR